MSVRPYQGHFPDIYPSAYVDTQATVIGKVQLKSDVSIWPQAVVRGDVHCISIGAGTNVQDGAVLHVTHNSPYNPGGHPLIIGEHVTIGHLAMLHGCEVGDTCLIGMRATLLDGAVIPPMTMVGAGSLVGPQKKLQSGYLWLGTPVKRIRQLTDKEIEFLTYSAKHYIKLKNHYLAKEVGTEN